MELKNKTEKLKIEMGALEDFTKKFINLQSTMASSFDSTLSDKSVNKAKSIQSLYFYYKNLKIDPYLVNNINSAEIKSILLKKKDFIVSSPIINIDGESPLKGVENNYKVFYAKIPKRNFSSVNVSNSRYYFTMLYQDVGIKGNSFTTAYVQISKTSDNINDISFTTNSVTIRTYIYNSDKIKFKDIVSNGFFINNVAANNYKGGITLTTKKSGPPNLYGVLVKNPNEIISVGSIGCLQLPNEVDSLNDSSSYGYCPLYYAHKSFLDELDDEDVIGRLYFLQNNK